MASISSPSFRINSSDPVLKTPAEIASLISIGANTVAFDAARQLVSQNSEDAVAYLLQAISARAIGRDAVCSDLLRAGLKAAPMTQELQIFNVLHEVESGQFEADSALVEKVISSNLEVEEFLFQISQRMILGPEDVISVDFALLGSKISWSIRRTHETIRSFGALYHWMPTYHNGVQNVDAFYRDYARYAKFNDPRNDRQRSSYTQRVRVTDGMKVLDAGCGSGTLLMAFRVLADVEQYGVDVSPGAGPHFLSNCPNGNFWAGDLMNTPFEDSKFDLIVSTDTLEHAFKPHQVMTELVRVAKPGALMAISVPDGRTDRYIGHINFFSGASLEFLLEEFGDVTIEYTVDGIYAELTVRK